MGCGGSKSKVDGLEAVSLCRGRSDHLAAAICHRYSLSSSHASHAASLRSLAASLHRFLLLLDTGDVPVPVPVLPLPTHVKGDPAAAPHSHSRSGSHISFHSSDSDTDDEFHLHSTGSSPGPTYSSLYYARGQPPPPSVSFEHRPRSPEDVHFASGDHSSSSYPFYAPQTPNYSYPYASSLPNYNSYYNGMNNFFAPSSPPASRQIPPGAATSSSGSKPAPPPPPPPPKASAWDFLNPFESNEAYYPPYTPGRNSVEVREEEGIPELEEEGYEVIKEAYGDQKFVASASGTSMEGYSSKMLPPWSKDGGGGGYGGDSRLRSAGASSSSEDESDVVEKAVAHEEQRRVAAPAAQARRRDVTAVADEIKSQSDRAFDSAMELSMVLEVGKQPYHHKNSVYEASSRIMRAMVPPSNSESGDLLDFEEDSVMSSRSLSSVLQQLYIWEKKLYDEVRAEEKLQLLHDKNCKRLKRLDERGAEVRKVDATRTLVRKLSTKIRIEIHVVESISNKINKLRDEELWPQINELIHGLSRMWKVMMECYQIQCRALAEAKSLGSIALDGKLSDTHMGAVVQLEMELLRWIINFSDWINAQRNFVKQLNGWLILCLNYQPEVTADGIPPYSPGRIGAPPVFIVCNYWSEAVDRISEREVVEAVQTFAANVRHLLEQHDVEQRQKLMADRDDKLLKTWERERQAIRREVDALRKKLVLVPGSIYGEVRGQGHTAELKSFQLGLKQIFKSMEDFTASTSKVYEELQLRSEEEMAG